VARLGNDQKIVAFRVLAPRNPSTLKALSIGFDLCLKARVELTLGKRTKTETMAVVS
jgi:hypothetical protein